MLSTFADMDGSFEYTASDYPIQALSCFEPLFEDVLKLGVTPEPAPAMVYFSRICSLFTKLSQEEKLNFIQFDSKERQFIVKNTNTKRKELQRMMKVMAEERLKEQVHSLEIKLGDFKHLDHPCFVLDPEIFISNLYDIQSCLMSRSCTIIVAAEGKYLITSFPFFRSK